MSEIVSHLLRKVYNLNGIVGALLHTKSTTNAEFLMDNTDLILLIDFDAEVIIHVGGAAPLTLQPTFTGLTLILIYDCNTEFEVYFRVLRELI